MTKQSKGKNIAMGIGIFVILALFIGFLSYQIGHEVYKSCAYQPTDATQSMQIVNNWQACNNMQSLAFSVTALLLSAVAIGIGLFLKKSSVVSGGLIGGGIAGLVTAFVGYYNYINDWVRIGLIGVFLIALLIFAYKKMS